MKVRAKFNCSSIEDFGESRMVNLSAVFGNTEENKDFTKYTPNGNLKLQITKDTPAFEFFKPTKSYYIDFSEVEV